MRQLPLLAAGLVILGVGCSTNDHQQPQPDQQSNPLLKDWDTSKRGVPFDQIRIEHFKPAFTAALAHQNNAIKAILANEKPNFANTIAALDASDGMLDRVRGVLNAMNNLNKSDELIALTAEINPLLEKQKNSVYSNPALFAKIKQVKQDSGKQTNLAADQRKLINDTYGKCVEYGANLESPEARHELIQINLEIGKLKDEFDNNLSKINENTYLDFTEEQIKQLGLSDAVVPEMLVGDKYRFNTDIGAMDDFLTYCNDRSLREKMYRLYTLRGNTIKHNSSKFTNPQIIEKLVTLRAKKAALILGPDKTYADLILKNRMQFKTLKTGNLNSGLYDFLEDIRVKATALCKDKEYSALSKFVSESTKGGSQITELKPWDWRYFQRLYNASLKREEQSEEEDRLELKLDDVFQAAFDWIEHLWNVKFIARPDYPVYQKDVKAFELVDQNQKVGGKPRHMGILYVDSFKRSGKGPGAFCDTIRKQYIRSRTMGKVGHYEQHTGPNGKITLPPVHDKPFNQFITPIAYVGYNHKSATITLDNAKTVFHELGHAMHGLLSNVKYLSQSGMEVPLDFVEMPSQTMERFTERALEKAGLIKAKTHNDRAATKIGQHFKTVELVSAAMLDLEWHTMTYSTIQEKSAKAKNSADFMRKFTQATADKLGITGLPTESRAMDNAPLPLTFRYNSNYFHHIFANMYDVGYYAYIAGEIFDADTVAAVKEAKNDEDFKKMAHRLRKHIYSVGSSVDLAESYKKFRGSAPNLEHFYKQRNLPYTSKN